MPPTSDDHDAPRRTVPARIAHAARAVLSGPLPRLPRPLEPLAEGWWRLPARVRLLALLAAGLLASGGLVARSGTSPWGPPVPVLVAATDATPGQPVTARSANWPARLVPPDHLAAPPEGVATRALRAGEVLTEAHVAPDLSHLLTRGEVAVALDQQLGLPAGVQVVVLGTDFDGRGRRLGRGRLVAADDTRTWIAVDRVDAPAVAAGLTAGQVTVALAGAQ